MSEFPGKNLYQINVSVIGRGDGPEPPVWRRLIVPKTIPLDKLHIVIQSIFGWKNMHLHRFEKGDLIYQDTSDSQSDDSDIENSTGVPLETLLESEGDEIKYIYDFGDYWKHTILLEESSLPNQVLPHIPICIEGGGRCPCEDSGGMWGYYDEDFDNVRDPNDSWHDELHDRLMRTRKVRDYDLEAINQRLAKLSFEH